MALGLGDQLVAASALVVRRDGVKARRLTLRATSVPDAPLAVVLAGADLLMALSDHAGALRLADRAAAMADGAERGAALRCRIEQRLGFYRESRATLARLDAARHPDLHARQVRIMLRAGDVDGAAEILSPLLAARPHDEELRAIEARLTAARFASDGTPRGESRAALDTVRTADPGVVLTRLEAVRAHHPASGLPAAYYGEALMWLGRWEESRVALERAIEIDRKTRWPYYGLSVLHLVAGQPDEAIEMCARGYAATSNTDARFAHSVRGEALRLLGHLDESARELGIALAADARRLSSHVNLALVHAAARHSGELRATFEHVAEQAPALIVAAATDCGVDLWRSPPGLPPWSGLDDDERTRVLRAMLLRMQGNRSASCTTWLNDQGVVRTVDGAPVDAAARDADRRLARAELIATFRQVAGLRLAGI